MLETCEHQVANIETQLQTTPKAKILIALASLIQTYLGDLCAALGTNLEHARTLVEKLIGKVTLHQEGHDLVAEIRGNLVGILGKEPLRGLFGAGSPSRSLPNLRGGYVVA